MQVCYRSHLAANDTQASCSHMFSTVIGKQAPNQVSRAVAVMSGYRKCGK